MVPRGAPQSATEALVHKDFNVAGFIVTPKITPSHCSLSELAIRVHLQHQRATDLIAFVQPSTPN